MMPLWAQIIAPSSLKEVWKNYIMGSHISTAILSKNPYEDLLSSTVSRLDDPSTETEVSSRPCTAVFSISSAKVHMFPDLWCLHLVISILNYTNLCQS